MNAPAVTVLMPVFNGARYLRESLASVLAQMFTDFELLVIDDGSTDESPTILASYPDPRMRVLRNEHNIGLVATLNRGLSEARGEWIARQDADDLSAPGRLAAQMAFVRGNPTVPLVGSDAWLIDKDGRGNGRWRTGGHADLVAWDLCFRAPFAHGSALFRRSIIFDRLGGYHDLRACEDLDLWSRVAREFPIVTMREPLVKYRLHEASIMASAAKDRARGKAVGEILQRTIRGVTPGLGEAERSCIAEVWSGGKPKTWQAYFEAVKALESGFLRGRRRPPGFAKLVAEQHYTLYYRERRHRRVLLQSLAGVDGAMLWHLPWFRMLAALFRR
jgi:glycosyltransferase involved in cell wall biosynthesis